jgi:hypothetical protein
MEDLCRGQAAGRSLPLGTRPGGACGGHASSRPSRQLWRATADECPGESERRQPEKTASVDQHEMEIPDAAARAVAQAGESPACSGCRSSEDGRSQAGKDSEEPQEEATEAGPDATAEGYGSYRGSGFRASPASASTSTMGAKHSPVAQGQREVQEERKRKRQALEQEQERSRPEELTHGWIDAALNQAYQQAQTAMDESAAARTSPGHADWHQLLTQCRNMPNLTLRTFGPVLLMILTSSPTMLGRSCRRQLEATKLETNTTPTSGRGELLPLPVDLSDVEQQVLSTLRRDQNMEEVAELLTPQLCESCWCWCMVLILNHLYFSPQSESGRAGETLPWARPGTKLTPNQMEAMRMISEEVEDFVVDAAGQEIGIHAKDWKQLLARRQVDYSGKLVSKATPISWKQIGPGLPSVDQAAQVNAMDLAEGDMRRIISSPWETMRPRSEWPRGFKRARTLAVSKEDYYMVVHGLWLRRMIREVKKEELLYDTFGTKLAGALFGIEKDAEVPSCPGLLVLRLILNLVPPNELQIKIAGDNQTLPYIGQWKNMNIVRGDPVYLNTSTPRP